MGKRLKPGLISAGILLFTLTGMVYSNVKDSECTDKQKSSDCTVLPQAADPPQVQAEDDILGMILPIIVAALDADHDQILKDKDNCPDTPNQDQLNSDNDAQGNACDTDDDNDGLTDTEEVALGSNPLKADTDGDGVNDLQDNFPLDSTKVVSYAKAHRLLQQATFGPAPAEIASIMTQGETAWVDAQLAKPSAYDSASDAHQTHLQRLVEIATAAEPSTNWNTGASFNQAIALHSVDEYQMATWWENVLGHPTKTAHGSDQLRQRIAFALSQILVVSNKEAPLERRGEGLAFYYDILARNAFGNYRDLLDEVARSPAMGIYLSHQGNRKTDLVNSTRPDENFARELIQLFTIGLYELNLDGSTNRDGNPNSYPDAGSNIVPSYTQEDVSEMAKVMTGWDLVGNNRYGNSNSTQGNYTTFMEFTASEHENEVAEGGDGNVTVLGQSFSLNAGTDGSGLDAALDVLFNHPNIGPFVSKHLIMRLVTSNPSSAYIARVASVFNNNGQGVRGDLRAVVRAILLDEEARDIDQRQSPTFGKPKEPLLALTQFLRAFEVRPLDGWIGRDDSTVVNGVYWYKYPEGDFGQGALRSLSVFNFYDPDFVPSDDYFSQNMLVAPELQIQTDQILVEMNNAIYAFINTYERNKVEVINGNTLATFAATKKFSTDGLLLIDFGDELAVYEQALDGDANGDFANMEATAPDGIRYKEKAIDALLTHLDQLLLGETMTTEYRAALKHYLMAGTGSKHSNNFTEAWINTKDAVRLMVTSSEFMVQK